MYKLNEKNQAVANMFSSIAGRYDLLNRILSFSIDKIWRRRAVGLLKGSDVVLDVATGTGDVALSLIRDGGVRSVVGVDLSMAMLRMALKKLDGMNVRFVCALGEELPFEGDSFDGVIIAFGIRNIVDRMSALFEFYRVLRRMGRLVILEFGMPPSRVVRKMYGIYSEHILPAVGRIVSGHDEAYSYLPASIRAFPNVRFMMSMIERAGFREVELYPLSLGISYIYTGVKF